MLNNLLAFLYQLYRTPDRFSKQSIGAILREKSASTAKINVCKPFIFRGTDNFSYFISYLLEWQIV